MSVANGRNAKPGVSYMVTLYFTKKFNKGEILEGLTVDTQMNFVSYDEAQRFANKMKTVGCKKWAYGPGWKMVDCSFQKYTR